MMTITMDNQDTELFDSTSLWTPVEFDKDKHDGLSDAYRHADGSITYVVYDDDGGRCNPREDDDGIVSTLIQTNTRCIDVDEDEAGLREAYDRWHRRRDREHLMARYLAIFRPDIAYFTEHWSAGDSYGWGYITTARWREVMYYPEPKEATAEAIAAWVAYEPSCSPQEAFDQEVSIYAKWCNGEVFGAIHEYPDRDEDSCWGFLGYDDNKEICGHFTASPITETLY